MNSLYEKWMQDTIFKETGINELSSKALRLYQLKKIRQTIDTAKKSRHYSKLLKDIQGEKIKDISDIKKLPFTTSEDLVNHSQSFICTPLHKISRIVTLNTSGTIGKSKRIYFTESDLEATIKFFSLGMLNLVAPGDNVFILMSGNSTSSIANLLKEGLERSKCKALIYGPVYNPYDTLETIKVEHIDCIVGLPIQVFYLAKLKNMNPKYKALKLKSILLSADYVPRSVCSVAGSAFSCPVFTHYGMTEMGYGGGIECSALNGYHMREIDLYTEIINPLTMQSATEGEYGEVVFTTLRRECMPLIRYRTGDIARFLPKACSCSDVFKRMDYVKGRLSENLTLMNGEIFLISMLDEIMFGIDNVLDYKAVIEFGERIVLDLHIKLVNKETPLEAINIKNALINDMNLGELIKNNNIILRINEMADEIQISNGMLKRRFEVNKK